MKKVFTLVALAGMFTFVACGPSAEEKAAREKAIQDSITAVETAAAEAAKAAEAAAAAEVAAKAAADAAAAEEAAKAAEAEAAKKGGKKK